MSNLSRGFVTVLFGALIFSGAGQPALTQSTHSVLVNVLNQDGNAVRNLTKESFRAKINGHPAHIVEADYTVAPRRIVVLLDVSGSMLEDREKRKWRIAREALEDLLTETPTDVPIALLTFSDHVLEAFGFSESRKSIATWIKEDPNHPAKIKIQGRTALFDAVLAATKFFGTPRLGDVIYAITDGDDNSSQVSDTAAKKLLCKSGIRFFVFLLSNPSLYPPEQLGKDSVVDIARATGGFVFGVSARSNGIPFLPYGEFLYDYDDRTRERIKFYTQALNIQVNGFYALRLESPVVPDKVRRVSVEIVNESGSPRKDVAFTHSSVLPQQP